MAREARDEARRWLWEHSTRDRQRRCGRDAVGQSVSLVVSRGVGRFASLETCGSIWACPVCSAKVLAGRADELRQALDAWVSRGGAVALVTLTMRHRADHRLEECWDALSDAWAAASGRSRGVRSAKQAAGVAGWARRVEVTWGAAHGWHVHAHALVFLREPGEVDKLADAMWRAWELRLRRDGLTPVRDSGGLDVKLLDVRQALDHVGDYVGKGAYTGERAALELAGTGKLGRGGNLTPWQLLDAAIAGDGRAAGLWREWERVSKGRRALTWSQGFRDELGLGQEVDDDELAAAEHPDTVTVAVWDRRDWPAVRDAPLSMRRQLFAIAASSLSLGYDAFEDVADWCEIFRLPLPRPPD